MSTKSTASNRSGILRRLHRPVDPTRTQPCPFGTERLIRWEFSLP
jgi:hypothetical protein